MIFSRLVFQRHLFLWCQINQLPIKKPSSETLLRLAELVLTPAQLFFVWRQLLKTNQRCCNGNQNGTNYVNLFIGYIEYKFFSNYHRPKHDLYKRYINNCVDATSSSEEGLNLFITSVNSVLKLHLGNFRKFISFPRH